MSGRDKRKSVHTTYASYIEFMFRFSAVGAITSTHFAFLRKLESLPLAEFFARINLDGGDEYLVQ